MSTTANDPVVEVCKLLPEVTGGKKVVLEFRKSDKEEIGNICEELSAMFRHHIKELYDGRRLGYAPPEDVSTPAGQFILKEHMMLYSAAMNALQRTFAEFAVVTAGIGEDHPHFKELTNHIGWFLRDSAKVLSQKAIRKSMELVEMRHGGKSYTEALNSTLDYVLNELSRGADKMETDFSGRGVMTGPKPESRYSYGSGPQSAESERSDSGVQGKEGDGQGETTERGSVSDQSTD